jgi:ribosome-binding factor A
MTGGAPRGAAGASAGRGGQRRLRVAEEIRHRLADIFLRADFRDPELAGANLTVTEVRVSPDLRNATAFVARLGRSDVAALLPALARATPYLQGEVARGMRLRRAPVLGFAADTALEKASRMDAVLRSPEVARDLGGG